MGIAIILKYMGENLTNYGRGVVARGSQKIDYLGGGRGLIGDKRRKHYSFLNSLMSEFDFDFLLTFLGGGWGEETNICQKRFAGLVCVYKNTD